MKFLSSFLVLSFLLVSGTASADQSTGLNELGQQVIEGDIAFAIYTNIKGEESPVRELCDPNDRSCDSRKVHFYSKSVEKLTCASNADKYYCYLTELTGQNPVEINSSKLSRRIYDALISTPTALGARIGSSDKPTGYSKTVVGIHCSRSPDNDFECSIEFRQ